MRPCRTSTAAFAALLSQAKARHAGFTLVELLVAATIALVVMGAVASLLGVFSRTSSSLQSLIDMTARMRVVGNELRSDLRGVTCDLRPPISPESDSGYFELIEGPMQDAITYDATTLKEYAKPYLTGTAQLLPERFNSGTNGRLLGDIDDVLALTTRTLAEPFVGRCCLFSNDATTSIMTLTGSTRFTTISSRTAEVAWFLQKSQTQVSGYDVYDLYRRQLLVLPYVGVSPFVLPAGSGSCQLTSGSSNTPIGTIVAGMNQLNILPWTVQTWTDYFGGLNFNGDRFYYDVSVRRLAEDKNGNSLLDAGEDTNGNGILDNFLVPNSLGDLTKRENRFWRWRYSTPPAWSTAAYAADFPYPFLWDNNVSDNKTPPVTFPSPGFNRKIDPVTGLPFVQETARQGEDVVLTNVISFDIRVFDPDAPIKANPSVGTPLIPGDPGYNDSASTLIVTTGNRATRGAYVDLGWDYGKQGAANFVFPINPMASVAAPGFGNTYPGSEDRHSLPANGGLDDILPAPSGNGKLDYLTAFQGVGMQPANRSLNYAITPSTVKPTLSYCTWSTHYESNGIDEDTEDANKNGMLDPGEDLNSNGVLDGNVLDSGTNGIDDNGDGIPDDPAERETSPPYPVPLRGIEVRIRCIEPTTKEIRQITIRHAFNQN